MKFQLTENDKKLLLKIARETLESVLGRGQDYRYSGEITTALEVETGMFVTLHEHGQLRGCIGYLSGIAPLWEEASILALSSALKDSRFYPVRKEELKDLEIEISVLTIPEKITSPDEIVLGQHGVIVKSGYHQGVFLPQVAEETGWDKTRFMNELCSQKAGLPADAWQHGDVEIFVFSAIVFNESDFNLIRQKSPTLEVGDEGGSGEFM